MKTFIVGIMVVALIELLGFLVPVHRLTEAMLLPVMQWSARVVAAVELPYLALRQNFRNYTYVQDLELRYAETIAQLGKMEALEKENRELRLLIEQPSLLAAKPIIAPILAYSQPYIGKGKRDGVQVGDLVFIARTFVGRIERVSESQSVVTLLAATTSLPILVQTEGGVTGVAVGQNGKLMMTEIPQDAQMSVGQRVITMGQPEVPQGLSLGKVQAIARSAVNSSQTAVIDQVVSFYQSQIVEVQPR